jgi:cytochrome c oxidase subunit IV
MQQHNESSSEITFHHEPAQGTKRIWRTFWILLIITVIELVLGLGMYLLEGSLGSFIVLFLKGVIVILSLAKAFYIVSVFMHLGDEIRNMIMTIVVPLILFVWFIGAFLWDGNYYRTSRNRYDPSLEYKTVQPPTNKADTSVRPLH